MAKTMHHYNNKMSLTLTQAQTKNQILIITLLLLIFLSCSNGLRMSETGRHFMATTNSGLETLLADEIKLLPDVTDIRIGKKHVSFTGSTASGLSALLNLRTSLKVMEKLLDKNDIKNKEDLYAAARGVDWSRMITPDQTLKCDCTLGFDVMPGNQSSFHHQTKLNKRHFKLLSQVSLTPTSIP